MMYILNLDKELFIYLNSLGSVYWDSFWMFLTNPFSSIPIYLILFWKSKNKMGWNRILWVILAVAIMVTITDQTSNLFKNILVRRLRPCHEESLISIMRLVKVGCGGQYGFFSAHAANSFVIFAFFSKLLNTKFWTISLFVWAFFVSYSRIYIGVHYPLDILCGIIYGCLSGVVIYKIFSIFNLFKNTSYYA